MTNTKETWNPHVGFCTTQQLPAKMAAATCVMFARRQMKNSTLTGS